MTRAPAWVGVGLALLAAVAFSTLGIWGKVAHGVGLSSDTLLIWRFGLTALLLFALGFGRERLPLRSRVVMLSFGVLYSLITTLFFAALARITVGTTSLLLYLAPAFVVFFAFLLGRRPHALQLVALVFTVLGLGVVVGLPGEADRDALGLTFGALAGVTYALYLLAAERALQGLQPLTVAAHVAVGAAGYFLVLGVASGRAGIPVGMEQWGVVLGIALLPTLLALPALFSAVSRLGATRASLLATTEPVWTVLLAALLLGEHLQVGTLTGGTLILAGALLAQLKITES